MIGYPLQLFHIWTGKGSNGKSLLSTFLNTTLGAYYGLLNVALITQKRGSADSANPSLSEKIFTRCLITSETDENQALNTGLMKIMTGGENYECRGLYKSNVKFIPQWKIILLCNNIPDLDNDDGGTRRRLRIIPFPFQFCDDPKLSNERQRDDNLENTLKKYESKLAFFDIHIKYLKLYKKEGFTQLEIMKYKT